MASTSYPPQLHLTLPANTTSFKRSFEEYGFDLESPGGVGDSYSSGGSNSGSSSGSERNKRARSANSSDDDSNRSVAIQSATSTSPDSSTDRSTDDSTATTSTLSGVSSGFTAVSGLSATRPAQLNLNLNLNMNLNLSMSLGLPSSESPPILSSSIEPPRLPTPEIVDIDMTDYRSFTIGDQDAPLFHPQFRPTSRAVQDESPPTPEDAEQGAQDRDEDYRAQLERFNVFDAQIATLRQTVEDVGARPARTSTPPPVLPPLELSSLNDDEIATQVGDEGDEDSIVDDDNVPSLPLSLPPLAPLLSGHLEEQLTSISPSSSATLPTPPQFFSNIGERIQAAIEVPTQYDSMRDAHGSPATQFAPSPRERRLDLTLPEIDLGSHSNLGTAQIAHTPADDAVGRLRQHLNNAIHHVFRGDDSQAPNNASHASSIPSSSTSSLRRDRPLTLPLPTLNDESSLFGTNPSFDSSSLNLSYETSSDDITQPPASSSNTRRRTLSNLDSPPDTLSDSWLSATHAPSSVPGPLGMGMGTLGARSVPQTDTSLRRPTSLSMPMSVRSESIRRALAPSSEEAVPRSSRLFRFGPNGITSDYTSATSSVTNPVSATPPTFSHAGLQRHRHSHSATPAEAGSTSHGQISASTTQPQSMHSRLAQFRRLPSLDTLDIQPDGLHEDPWRRYRGPFTSNPTATGPTHRHSTSLSSNSQEPSSARRTQTRVDEILSSLRARRQSEDESLARYLQMSDTEQNDELEREDEWVNRRLNILREEREMRAERRETGPGSETGQWRPYTEYRAAQARATAARARSRLRAAMEEAVEGRPPRMTDTSNPISLNFGPYTYGRDHSPARRLSSDEDDTEHIRRTILGMRDRHLPTQPSSPTIPTDSTRRLRPLGGNGIETYSTTFSRYLSSLASSSRDPEDVDRSQLRSPSPVLPPLSSSGPLDFNDVLGPTSLAHGEPQPFTSSYNPHPRRTSLSRRNSNPPSATSLNHSISPDSPFRTYADSHRLSQLPSLETGPSSFSSGIPRRHVSSSSVGSAWASRGPDWSSNLWSRQLDELSPDTLSQPPSIPPPDLGAVFTPTGLEAGSRTAPNRLQSVVHVPAFFVEDSDSSDSEMDVDIFSNSGPPPPSSLEPPPATQRPRVPPTPVHQVNPNVYAPGPFRNTMQRLRERLDQQQASNPPSIPPLSFDQEQLDFRNQHGNTNHSHTWTSSRNAAGTTSNDTSNVNRSRPRYLEEEMERRTRQAPPQNRSTTARSRDINTMLLGRVRMEPSRPENPALSSSSDQSLRHALEVLRPDGLSSSRQHQFMERLHQNNSSQSQSTARHGSRPGLRTWGGQWGTSSGVGDSILPTPPRERLARTAARPQDGPFDSRGNAPGSMSGRAARLLRQYGGSDMPTWDYLASNWGNLRRAGRFRMGDFMRDDDFDPSYESLVQLGTSLGDVKPRGTPNHVVAGMDTAFYKDWANADSDKRCPICLDDYKELDPVLKLPDCTHWLHKECLEQWLKSASTCPVCRKTVKTRSRRHFHSHRAHRHDHDHTGSGPSGSAAG